MMRLPPSSPLFPLHDALPICNSACDATTLASTSPSGVTRAAAVSSQEVSSPRITRPHHPRRDGGCSRHSDRKSTRLNSSHSQISYAVFCLKKKKNTRTDEYFI